LNPGKPFQPSLMFVGNVDGRLLALPTNIRQGWKGLPWTNTQACNEKFVNYERKSFITLAPGVVSVFSRESYFNFFHLFLDRRLVQAIGLRSLTTVLSAMTTLAFDPGCSLDRCLEMLTLNLDFMGHSGHENLLTIFSCFKNSADIFWGQCYETFYGRKLRLFVISECLSLTSLSSLV